MTLAARPDQAATPASCLQDRDSCLLACFCPCIQFGKNYVALMSMSEAVGPQAAVGQHTSTAAGACSIYCFCMYFTGCISMGILGGAHRIKLRNKYHIGRADCADAYSDTVIHCCCAPCA